MVFLHQQGINLRVRLEQVDITGGSAAVKQREKVPLTDVLHRVGSNVGKVVQAVAGKLELAHCGDGVGVGFQNRLPLVNHGLHFKTAPAGGGIFQHDAVGGAAGDYPAVKVLPLFAAKGQVVDDLFRFAVDKPVHQEIFGGEVHNHASQIKDDVFIHTRLLLHITLCLASIIHAKSQR